MSMQRRFIAVLVAGGLLAGCSGGPVSQATTIPSDGPSAAPSLPSAEPSSEPSVTPTPSVPPAPTKPAATPTDVPPKPGNPTFTLVNETPRAEGGSTVEYEITWTSPAGLASEFLVYGVTVCLRDGKEFQDKPCVARGMKIPRASLALIGRAPGDARSIRVSWDLDELGPGPYWSILMRATNSFGNSIFTIVQTENVCYQCTY
ncbi:MAG: hypothetical protein Q8M74_05335 [Chloroflexota bacterium]|nr:hypothetical protein [Chloroflexota bacterium]